MAPPQGEGAIPDLLFGPTAPNVWAPTNENVQVLRAPSGRLNDLGIAPVKAAVAAALLKQEMLV